jgi:lysophospholipase L1-like esterase
MMHGEVPKLHQPKLAVIMIGTNDLGAASSCSGGDPRRISEVIGGVEER